MAEISWVIASLDCLFVPCQPKVSPAVATGRASWSTIGASVGAASRLRTAVPPPHAGPPAEHCLNHPVFALYLFCRDWNVTPGLMARLAMCNFLVTLSWAPSSSLHQWASPLVSQGVCEKEAAKQTQTVEKRGRAPDQESEVDRYPRNKPSLRC